MAAPTLSIVNGRVDLSSLPEDKQLLVGRLLAEKVNDDLQSRTFKSDTDRALAFYLGLAIVSNDDILSAVNEAYEE